MQTASSARATCRELASAEEYTATVRTFRRLQVAIIRQAISPRLAIRIWEGGVGGRRGKTEGRRGGRVYRGGGEGGVREGTANARRGRHGFADDLLQLF